MLHKNLQQLQLQEQIRDFIKIWVQYQEMTIGEPGGATRKLCDPPNFLVTITRQLIPSDPDQPQL